MDSWWLELVLIVDANYCAKCFIHNQLSKALMHSYYLPFVLKGNRFRVKLTGWEDSLILLSANKLVEGGGKIQT